MSVPLRKPMPEENLTTEDLAQGKRPAGAQNDVNPVPSSSKVTEFREPPSPTQTDGGNPALFPTNELDELRNRWNTIQTGFVDEPRRAVEQADGLVASAMKRLAEVFADERSRLEKQWDRGGDVPTEDLRIALQRYRSFFHRLLSV
jgi:hypothetical protein